MDNTLSAFDELDIQESGWDDEEIILIDPLPEKTSAELKAGLGLETSEASFAENTCNAEVKALSQTSQDYEAGPAGTTSNQKNTEHIENSSNKFVENESQTVEASAEQNTVGTETSDLIVTFARSSSTEDSCIHTSELVQPTTLMTTSISTGSDGSEEERFVKVKPGDFEFESSKSSSQSGKDNLEFEEQIHALSSQCTSLRSELTEKENDYLKVKLELESVLLEKNVECDTLTKSSQELTKIKDELFQKDQEIMDLRSSFEESKQIFEDYEFLLASQEKRQPKLEPRRLPDMLKYVISLLQEVQMSPQKDSVENSSTGFTTIELNNDKIQTEIEKLNLELNEKLSIIEEVSLKNKNLEELLQSTQTELEELTEQQNDVIGGYQSVTASLEEAQVQLAKLQNELVAKTQEFDELSESNKGQKNEIDRFKQELLSKDEDIEELQKIIDEVKSSALETEKEVTARNLALKDEITRLEQLIAEKESVSSNNDENSEIETIRTALTNKEQELQDVIQQLQATKKELNDQTVQSGELQVKFKKALATIKQKNTQLAELKQNEASGQNRASPDIGQVSNLESELLKLRAELQEKVEQLLEMKSVMNDLESKNKTLEEESAELGKLLEEETNKLVSSEEQLNKFVKISAEKNDHIEQLMRNAEELQDLANRQNDELTSAIKAKEEEIRELLKRQEEYVECCEQENNQLRYTVRELTADCNSGKEIEEEFGQLTHRLHKSEQEQQFLSLNLEEANLLLEEKNNELQAYLREIKMLEERVDKLVTELEQKTSIVEDLNETIVGKNEALHLLEFRVNECQATIVENDQLIEEMKSELETKLYELNNSRRNEEEAIQCKDSSYKELSQLKAEYKYLQLQLFDTETRIQQIINEHERKALELETLKDAEVLGSRNELCQVKQELELLERRFQESQELVLLIESEKSNLLDKIKLSETDLTDARNKISLMENEIKIKQTLVSKLESEGNELREQVKILLSEQSESQSKIQELNMLLDAEKNSDKVKSDASTVINPENSTKDGMSKTFEQEKAERQALERKIDLLQNKILEIESSEMKAFEECLMLKTWMRELELENIKNNEELQRYQSLSGRDSDPKLKTMQNEIIRLIETLEDRDKRTTQLTIEITRLYEERDALQIKLSNALKHNVNLNEKLNSGNFPNVVNVTPVYDKEQLEKKLAELEDINYSMNVDLKREKEARRLVQEQLLFSQTSKFYRDRNKAKSTLPVSPRVPFPVVQTISATSTAVPTKSIQTEDKAQIINAVEPVSEPSIIVPIT